MMTSQEKLNALIQEMSIRAAREADSAWQGILKDGSVGSLILPIGDRTVMSKWFRLGYSKALLDHVEHAVAKLKGVGDVVMETEITKLIPS